MSIKTVLPQTVFVVVLVICALFGSCAWAWGELKELDTYSRYTHLIYPVYQYHRINYCITIRDGAAGHFSYSSMNIEVRMALRQWLNAVRKFTGPVAINNVSCSNPLLDLMVDVGPPPPPHMHNIHQSFSFDDGKYPQNFFHVVISSTYSYFHDGIKLHIYDFAYVVNNFLAAKGLTFKSLLSQISTHSVPYKTISGWVKQQWGEQSAAMVYNSSYPFLLHELGHSFGLCDTYDVTLNCDPRYVSNWYSQPPSVMAADNFFYLTNDDISGIQHLFFRFLYLSRK